MWSILITVLISTGIASITATVIISKIKQELDQKISGLLLIIREDEKIRQEWLFEQLYRQTPGKVLKPDEIENSKKIIPAKVYSPSKDPMSEFSGERDDWRD
jgi:hypothetical protein